jgi:hypothetical protein
VKLRGPKQALDHVGPGNRTVADRIVELSRMYKKSGMRIGKWGRKLAPGMGEARARPNWANHSYTLKDMEGGILHITEPYYLANTDIKALAELVDTGWNIEISPQLAMHFPGRTMAITFRHG